MLRSLVPIALAALACGCDNAAMLRGDAGPDAAALDAVASDVLAGNPCGLDATPSAACPLCAAGASYCTDDGLGIRRCDPDGLGYSDVARCDAAGGELCSAGRCVQPCDDAAASNSYQGCEFYAVGTLNSSLGHAYLTAARDDFPFAIGVTNPWAVPVTLTLEGGGLPAPRTATVAPQDSAVLELPWLAQIAEGGSYLSVASTLTPAGAVHVRASAPVGVYQFNPRGYATNDDCNGPQCYSYTNDASLLLPVAALRSQYLVVTRPTVRVKPHDETKWHTSSGFLTVVGTSDAPTTVTVRLRGRVVAGGGLQAAGPGDTLARTLARGDVWQLVSDNGLPCVGFEPDNATGDVFCTPVPEEDLTGTVVESSAPVAVFSGHDCALVPYDRYACDHLEEQLFPTESLGAHYLVARTPPASDEPDLLRVVATRDGTTVQFAPAGAHDPVTLAHAGDVVEFEQRTHLEVTATQPVLVAQFLVGANYDPTNTGALRGDPDLVLAVPVEQFRNRYDFVAEDGFPDGTAIVFAPHGERLLYDGREVSAPPVGAVGSWDVFYLDAYAGAHHLAAFHPGTTIGLIVSGLADYTSYTYPGGLGLAPISPPL